MADLADRASGPARVLLTGRRAVVLGLMESGGDPVAVTLAEPPTPDAVSRLADPCLDLDGPLPAIAAVTPLRSNSAAAAAVTLAKLARLLPAALVVDLPHDFDPGQGDPPTLGLQARDILDYQIAAARSLRKVSEARVPLSGAEDTRIIAFRPSDGGTEHLAIIVGTPDPDQPTLARLHSECFTGDLLGSLRCDCGDQLRGAIEAIARQGSGVLLYLAQEGRGIGLVNKLRAYQLQDQGFDTLDANGQLGFDDDERIYLPAAEILRLLGLSKVRLLTNNPLKVEALARHGIQVVERVPHVYEPNPHNLRYLETKARKGGHLF
jgi:GTP cyclohydrolase II